MRASRSRIDAAALGLLASALLSHAASAGPAGIVIPLQQAQAITRLQLVCENDPSITCPNDPAELPFGGYCLSQSESGRIIHTACNPGLDDCFEDVCDPGGNCSPGQAVSNACIPVVAGALPGAIHLAASQVPAGDVCDPGEQPSEESSCINLELSARLDVQGPSSLFSRAQLFTHPTGFWSSDCGDDDPPGGVRVSDWFPFRQRECVFDRGINFAGMMLPGNTPRLPPDGLSGADPQLVSLEDALIQYGEDACGFPRGSVLPVALLDANDPETGRAAGMTVALDASDLRDARTVGSTRSGWYPMTVRFALTRPEGGSLTALGFSTRALSDDGAVAVGSSNLEAVRWTESFGAEGLGDLPGGAFTSTASGVSADGSVVVGFGNVATGTLGNRAYRWTASTGMVPIGSLSGAGFSSGVDVSDSGAVVVGNAISTSGTEAFRWTSASGMVGLGDLPGGAYFSTAGAVSGDGSVVVGQSEASGGYLAYRWTAQSGMVGLGELPGGDVISRPNGVSSDGLVVVGESSSASGYEAFRWTEQTGMVGLGDLPGGTFESRAEDISADGSIVVGVARGDQGAEAFVWDASNGMRPIADVLASAGLDISGWRLFGATGVSADGRTVVGDGLDPSANPSGWIATLPEVIPISGGETCESVPTACTNGLDDDGDGLSDLLDPGCAGAADLSEQTALRLCDDGIDNDGDGTADFPADPGCKSPTWSGSLERTQCQDGADNDNQIGFDFDGGASLDLDDDGFVDAQFNPATPALGAPDPQCTAAWVDREAAVAVGGCGFGPELALLLPPLWWARRARRRSGPT
jgi:probable HAF family extracellular repeat protein